MVKTTCTYRVTYADTDKMGYLYYGLYAKLYEIGRAEQTRELGLPYRELEDEHGIMMPVAQLSCRYKMPAYYDDLLTIESRIVTKPRRIMHYQHSIYNQDGALLNEGEVKLFFVEMSTQKSVQCPPVLLSKLESYF